MLQFRFMKGKHVPIEARELTRGKNGRMQSLYDHERKHMLAMLLFKDNVLIGWCCAIRQTSFFAIFFEAYTDEVEIHTFVHPDYRRRGYGTQLLDRATRALRLVNPKMVVKYGAPKNDADFFNKTYEATIAQGGLKPDRYFCL